MYDCGIYGLELVVADAVCRELAGETRLKNEISASNKCHQAVAVALVLEIENDGTFVPIVCEKLQGLLIIMLPIKLSMREGTLPSPR
jgi:hypothetical protein